MKTETGIQNKFKKSILVTLICMIFILFQFYSIEHAKEPQFKSMAPIHSFNVTSSNSTIETILVVDTVRKGGLSVSYEIESQTHQPPVDVLVNLIAGELSIQIHSSSSTLFKVHLHIKLPVSKVSTFIDLLSGSVIWNGISQNGYIKLLLRCEKVCTLFVTFERESFDSTYRPRVRSACRTKL
jgi:hypothetical protein